MLIFDKILVLVICALLPLDNHLPLFYGSTYSFVVYGISFFYHIIFSKNIFIRIIKIPIFKYIAMFAIIAFISEALRINSSHYYLRRTILMYLGAVLLSISAIKIRNNYFIFNSIIISGIFLFVVNSISTYSYLSTFNSTESLSFYDASSVKGVMGEAMSFQDNQNTIGLNFSLFYITTLFYSINSKGNKRNILFIISLSFLLGSLMTMSRSTIIINVVTTILLLKFQKIISTYFLKISAGIFIVYLLTPTIVFDRLFSTLSLISDAETALDIKDSRFTLLYNSAYYFFDVFPFGAGDYNYWNDWGINTRFSKNGYKVSGTHNVFSQLYYLYGIIPAMLFIQFNISLYKIIAKGFSKNKLINKDYIFLSIIHIFIFLSFFLTHQLYIKLYSVSYCLIIMYLYSIKYSLKKV